MSKNLENLLIEKRQEFDKNSEFHIEKRDEWISRIEALINQIENWLKPLSTKGHFQISRQNLEISEETYGKYKALSLVIGFFNGQAIKIIPKGLGVIGVNGRVDVEMGGRQVMIVGMPDGNTWEFAERDGRQINRFPFNRENFEDLISVFVSEF